MYFQYLAGSQAIYRSDDDGMRRCVARRLGSWLLVFLSTPLHPLCPLYFFSFFNFILFLFLFRLPCSLNPPHD